MSPNPPGFVEHLRAEGYHPRSNKHSNALAEEIVGDLVSHCPIIRAQANSGSLVYDLNFTLFTGTAEWNVDIVIGEPPMDIDNTQVPSAGILRLTPSSVRIAIEIKSVMTEHRKAVKNRKRDFEAHHDHVHRYGANAIAGGVLVVNAADVFRSPLRASESVTVHTNPDRLVEHCVDQMRAVSNRDTPDSSGLDAKTVIVVKMDNIYLNTTSYVTRLPAPRIGDPMHYDAFIQRICSIYGTRFGA